MKFDLEFLRPIADTALQQYQQLLTITAGSQTFSFFDQFKAQYLGRLPKYYNRPTFEKDFTSHFLLIIEDNKYILKQIEKELEFLALICDLGNGKDSNNDVMVKYSDNKDKHNTNNLYHSVGSFKDKIKTTTLNSDNNSYTDTQLEEGIPQESITDSVDYALPINQYQKNLTDDDNKSESTSINTYKKEGAGEIFEIIKNIKDMSNVSKDVRDFGNLELPALRQRFLNKFKPLFLGQPS